MSDKAKHILSGEITKVYSIGLTGALSEHNVISCIDCFGEDVVMKITDIGTVMMRHDDISTTTRGGIKIYINPTVAVSHKIDELKKEKSDLQHKLGAIVDHLNKVEESQNNTNENIIKSFNIAVKERRKELYNNIRI
jgi:peptidoglycan hydrolase CwlO-like protein